MTRAIPERIPDVSMMHFPLLGREQGRKLRVKEHAEMERERRCHAFEGREYHYCGRTAGRMFPLAAPPAPDIEISTTIWEGGKLPRPTLPNPSVGLKSGLPVDQQPKPLLESERDVWAALCAFFAVALAVWAGVIYRFSHPELTETQLFLGVWPAALAALALIAIAGMLRRR